MKAASTFKAGDLVIHEPWLRATPGGAKIAGGYVRITSSGQSPDRLVGGSLDRAQRFEVHEMSMVDNVMKMKKLANGRQIKPGETGELKPGSYHVMGLDLTSGYKAVESVKGTLTFEKAGTVAVEFRVASDRLPAGQCRGFLLKAELRKSIRSGATSGVGRS